METIGTLTTLQIQAMSDGKTYVVIKQVVEYPSGKKESIIVLTPDGFEDMVATYQATKSSAITTINALKDLGQEK
jgi:hypothetical protein